MRAGFAQFLAFSQDAADNRTFLAQGKLQMPVLSLGGEATFGPMIGVVMRPRRQNLSSTSCIAVRELRKNHGRGLLSPSASN